MPRLRSRLDALTPTARPPGRPDLAGLRLAVAETFPPPDAAADPLGWVDYELRATAVLVYRGMRYTGAPGYVLDPPFEDALTRLGLYRLRLIEMKRRAGPPDGGAGAIDAFLAAP